MNRAAIGPHVSIDRNWSSVAEAVRCEGGLLFGGLDNCLWNTTVLGSLSGFFRGPRMVSCSGHQSVRNKEALKAVRPPKWCMDGRTVPTLAQQMSRVMGEDVSDDDRWFIDAAKSGATGCQRIVNGMADRMERMRPPRYALPFPYFFWEWKGSGWPGFHPLHIFNSV